MKHSGKFIALEGLEGAGKSTAIATIVDWLKTRGVERVITTREPGGTDIAEKLRIILKTPARIKTADNQAEPEVFSPVSELLLMYAARVQLVSNIIQPALQEGAWVIGDRHELSTFAYQGGGRGVSQKNLLALHDLCLGEFKPDLTLYLDIPPKVGFQRIQSRGYKDRIEQEDLTFFERVRDVYLSYISEEKNVFQVDASLSLEKVHRDIIHILENMLKKWI
jgi:dTMP kinase